MRFEYEGKTYQITFSREYKETRTFTGELVRSKYPYTTARIDIVELDAEGKWQPKEKFREATVGCWTKEKKGFHPNKGRVHALRCINETIPRAMLVPMWDAYNHRFPPKKLSIKLVAEDKQRQALLADRADADSKVIDMVSEGGGIFQSLGGDN